MKVDLGKDTSGRPLILDDTTLAKVRWAEAQLGWRFALIQGSYRAADPLARSGGTHDAGGAVDLRTWDIPASVGITRALRALREAGLIAWHRHQSVFPDHEIHALDYGNPGLSPSAHAQVAAWKRGRNGLSGSLEGPDDGPKVDIPTHVPGGPVPTEVRAVDYSDARPDLGMVKARSYVGIGRYLGGRLSKRLTADEAVRARALDLDIWLVYESSATRALAGRDAGVRDAKAAEKQARAVGYPQGSVIFFAVDADLDPEKVRPYFDGVKATLTDYEAGDYGSVRITEAGLTDWHWQTAAWSGGRLSQKAHLYQRATPNGPLPAGCDENVYCRDFPRWTSNPPEDDMTPDQMLDALESDRGQALLQKAVLGVKVINRNPDGSEHPQTLGDLLTQVEVGQDRLGATQRAVQGLIEQLQAVAPDVAAIRAKVTGA